MAEYTLEKAIQNLNIGLNTVILCWLLTTLIQFDCYKYASDLLAVAVILGSMLGFVAYKKRRGRDKKSA